MMRFFERRKNQKLREDLQDMWMKEAEAAESSPINTQKLWQKIDQSLTRESLSLVSVSRPRPTQGYWIAISAAAVLMLSVLGSMRLREQTDSVPQAESPSLDLLLSHSNREPLQTPSRLDLPRCDQTRQSCLFVAFL